MKINIPVLQQLAEDKLMTKKDIRLSSGLAASTMWKLYRGDNVSEATLYGLSRALDVKPSVLKVV